MSVLMQIVRARDRARKRRRAAVLEHVVHVHVVDDTARGRVLQQLLDVPEGLVYSELAQLLRTHPNHITGPIHELRAAGLVFHAGWRPSRATGVTGKVWRATSHARAYHAPDKLQVRLEAWT